MHCATTVLARDNFCERSTRCRTNTHAATLFATTCNNFLHFRKRCRIHKRLMLTSTISILTAAIARLPGVLALGPLAFFALTDLFVVVGLVYDRITRGRVHPAFWWGGGLLLASQIGRLALSGTAGWLAFATWLTR